MVKSMCDVRPVTSKPSPNSGDDKSENLLGGRAGNAANAVTLDATRH